MVCRAWWGACFTPKLKFRGEKFPACPLFASLRVDDAHASLALHVAAPVELALASLAQLQLVAVVTPAAAHETTAICG